MPFYFYLIPLAGYLLGSIPFGLLLAKVFGYGDIRNIGSGNIGATNVLRTGNKFLAILTLLLDIGKGYAAVRLSFLSQDMLIIFATAFLVIIGHMYPVWLKFKGGKGVATAIGTILALTPPLGAVILIIWLIVAVAFRISSLAALTAFALAPIYAVFAPDLSSLPSVFSIFQMSAPDYDLAVLLVIMNVMIFWKHRENIKRLARREEPKISFGKK